MTERLYYEDPYTREFDATITGLESRDGRMHVWLDRSAFTSERHLISAV